MCGCLQRTTVLNNPATIQFPITEDNRHQLEQWVLDHFRFRAFNTCLQQTLQMMRGKPLNITFIPGTIPIVVHAPIPVAHHWKKVKQDLGWNVSLGIIEPVPVGKPSTWKSRIGVAPKKDGTPRRIVDLRKLNAATMWETHHMPFLFLNCTIHMKKTVLDAWNGYHSLPLAPAMQNTAMFIMEWGPPCTTRFSCVRWGIHLLSRRSHCQYGSENQLH